VGSVELADARQHDELADRRPGCPLGGRVDPVLERLHGVDVRRDLAALDLLDDAAQQRAADLRVVRVVRRQHRQLAP
jgi:hypothetical protein